MMLCPTVSHPCHTSSGIKDNLFKSLKYEQKDSDVEISWDPVPLREQTAFIRGYVLYYWDDNNMVFSVSTHDPEATSLTARNLKITSYTFTVMAQTAVGQCGNTSTMVTLDSLTDNLIKSIFICLGAAFGLLSLTTILCYRNWPRIRQKVYPPIPKPVLRDKWLTVAGEHNHLYMDPSHHSEADIMDIPELLYKSGSPVSGYISQEDMPFGFTQTPIGYYNKPLKNSTLPPPLTLPTAVISPPSGLPLSPFRGVFTNLSYNPKMVTGDQQSSSGPEVQEGIPIMRCSSEYQPQSLVETFSPDQGDDVPDSPMSCVSTYILLPQRQST